MERILVIGANGQIGCELVGVLAENTRQCDCRRHRCASFVALPHHEMMCRVIAKAAWHR